MPFFSCRFIYKEASINIFKMGKLHLFHITIYLIPGAGLLTSSLLGSVNDQVGDRPLPRAVDQMPFLPLQLQEKPTDCFMVLSPGTALETFRCRWLAAIPSQGWALGWSCVQILSAAEAQ